MSDAKAEFLKDYLQKDRRTAAVSGHPKHTPRLHVYAPALSPRRTRWQREGGPPRGPAVQSKWHWTQQPNPAP